VRFDPSAAHTAPVWRDARWEVRIEAWLPGQSGGLTEHLDRPGALLVLQGALVETTWVIATDGPTPGRRHAVARRYAADDVRSHGDVHVHEVRNAGPDPAIALNVRRRG
jgi:hypothetical protein